MTSPLPTRIAFSDEQAMLLEAATAFCREQSPKPKVRSLITDESGFDPAVWRQMAELGWLGLTVPERFGGSGLPAGHLAVLAEPMGRHLLAGPFVATQLAIQGLIASGREDWQAQVLPGLAAGGIASVALFEDDGGWAIDKPAAWASRRGNDLALAGTKTLVPDAAAADWLLVSVLLEGGLALALLKRDQLPAGALAREPVFDETRRSFTLKLDGTVLAPEALLQGQAAQRAIQAITRCAWLLAAAEAAGGIAGALDVTVDYLNTRTAFGRKIGSYQGLKHPAADMLVQLERARSHVAHAATLMNDGAEGATLDIALRMAKVEGCESLVFAGDRAVQFHGGFGFTYDCDAQLYLRRAMGLAPWFGDAAHHRRALADLLWPLAA